MDTSELKNITNLVIIADTHFGSRSAVCPPRVYWDKGAYSYNKVQRKLWQYWRYFHDVWVPEATRGEKFLYVHVGDVIDGDHHETTDNISNNIAAQFAIADTVLSPLLENKKCMGMLLLRGTDAHDGKDGQHAETVGRLIGTVHSDDRHEQYSHPEAYVKCGKGLVHFKHTVGRGQGASEFTAVHKVYLSMLTNAARWGRPIPTYVVRAHQHVYRAP